MRKLDIEFIGEQFEKEGYILLTTEYINNKQKLEYVCPNGHKHSISWGNWYKGVRCPYWSNLMKLSINFIKSEFAKEDYRLLTKKYINSKQKLEYICSEGYKHSISWNSWQQGCRCPHHAGNAKPTIEFIKSEFEKENYVLLIEEYINNYQKLEYICPKGHRHNVSWNNWQHGQRCPECTNRISKGEIEVRNFVESLGVGVLSNDRNQIVNPDTRRGLELDVWMPNINKAIEYNGEYWHQDESRDLLKQKLCKSKGIDLLVVQDKEWKIERDVCKDKVIKFLLDI